MSDDFKPNGISNGHVNNAFTISEGVDRNGDVESVKKCPPEEEFPTPLRLCRLVCNYPKACFGVTLCLHLVMLAITGLLVRVGYDIIPFKLEQLPLFLNDHVDYQRGMAWSNRNADPTIIDPTNFDGSAVTNRSKTNSVIQLYFDGGNKNVFTKANFLLMKQAEDTLFNDTFKSDFCLKMTLPDGSRTCFKPMSILRFFDGTYGAAFNDPNFDNVVGILHRANSTPTLRVQLRGFLGLNAVVNSTHASSTITRMTLTTGGPFPGYRNLTDRAEEQADIIKEHVIKKMKPKFEEWYSGLGPDMVVYPFSRDLISDYIVKQAIVDMSLAMGSMLFICVFLIIQTGSTWIAGFGTLSIVTSFTWANAIYRIIIDFRFFGTFHILSIFIILGIGADDFFVFLDTWKLSAHTQYPSLAHRLSAVYRKAGLAMLFTSLTTAVAFFISGASPLLAINSFGIFSGILVIINYISVITFFPCVVITHHRYWSGKCCRCSRGCCGRPPLSDKEIPEKQKKNFIVRFFAGPYYKFITHSLGKATCIVLAMASLIFFGYFAGQIKPNDEETEFLPPTTSIGKYLKASTTRFMPSNQDRTLAVLVVWGLKGQDRSSCHKTDYKCDGTTIWDPDFDLNSARSQEDLMNFCEKLKTLTDARIDELKIRKDPITNEPEVACFIDEMDDYFIVEQINTTKYSNQALRLPTTKNSMKNVLMTNNDPEIYKVSTLDANFDRWFEIGLQHWLFSGYNSRTMLRSPQYKSYQPLVGSSIDRYSYDVQTQPFPPSVIKYGTRLRYAAVQINTTLLIRKLTFMDGLPIRDRWESFVTAEIANMSEPLKRGFMTSSSSFTGSMWHWLQVQKVLISSAITGVVIGVCVAFPILLIATMNILVALYATIIIGCVTMSVIGTIPLAGWTLGTLESLNLVLVVGLAVDYVVHLAEGYCRSPKADRKGRVRDMLEEVGISVLSGAITTLGSSFFLFMAVITFFKQFGVFMFATIGFSIFYSLVLFVATLALIGPQGDFCSLKPLWCRFQNWITPSPSPTSNSSNDE